MRKSIFLLVLILVVGLAGCSKKTSKLDQVRTWTTTDGETLQARWDRTDESNPDMICLVSNGEKYDIDIKDLSDDDQEYIQQKRSKFRKREKATSVNTEAAKTKNKKSLKPEELFQLGEKWATADHGKGTQDWDKAVKYYRQAAELGHSGAMVQLGYCYINTRHNKPEAEKWLHKAAELGNPAAFFWLGTISENRTDAERWFQRCFEACNAQKDSDDPVIQFLLASCYLFGVDGVKQDAHEAIKRLRKAAEQGLALAQFALAECYRNGNGVEANPYEALKWLRKAAEQGIPAAQLYLGRSYRDGADIDTPKDEHEAVKWFRKAAKQENEFALFALENMAHRGNIDALEAIKEVCKEMAERGNANALEYLKGVLKDLAEEGNANAQKELNELENKK